MSVIVEMVNDIKSELKKSDLDVLWQFRVGILLTHIHDLEKERDLLRGVFADALEIGDRLEDRAAYLLGRADAIREQMEEMRVHESSAST